MPWAVVGRAWVFVQMLERAGLVVVISLRAPSDVKEYLYVPRSGDIANRVREGL